MRPFVRLTFGCAIAALVVTAPLLYRVYVERTFRNFRVVRPGVLYRSGQLTHDGLVRMIHDHGIRTVISLRDSYVPGLPPPDRDEEEFCLKEEIYYFRLSPKHWWADEGSPPADENVRQFLAILDDPKYYPVLVHCMAGSHRTGAYCAIYRMEYDHWENAEAMNELYAGGYTHLWEEEDIRTYLEHYTPRFRRSEKVTTEAQGHRAQD
jgi:protein tyrosine/serine phosphatase